MTTLPTEDTNRTESLFRKYQETKSPEIRDELIENNLYLAEILAHKYAGRGVEYEDLFQVAAYALVLAVDRFDADKGILFPSYATPTIIGEIKKYFRDTTWSLKVPRRIKETSLKIPQARAHLQETQSHIPTVKELAEYIGVAEEEIVEALESSRAYTTYSLDQEADENPESENALFEKFLGSEEDGYDRIETLGVFEKVMADLSPTERDILRRRFLDEVTQWEVAEALGVSQMTVSRIEKAMKKKFRMEYNK